MLEFQSIQKLMLFMAACAAFVQVAGCDSTAEPRQRVAAEHAEEEPDARVEDAAAEQADATTVRELLDRPVQDLHDLGLRHVALLRSLYRARDYRPVWLHDAADHPLSEHGAALFAALRDAERVHGLWREAYHIDTLEALVETRSAGAPIDLYLSDALLQYGFDMRWSNDAWTRDHEWPAHLAKPATDTRIARDELRQARREHVAAKALMPVFADESKVTQLLNDLIPPFEQYARLVEAYRSYREIVEQGGWQPLPDDVGELKTGDESEHVVALKQRLAAEGYWKGDETPTFTDSLADALRHYQKTHQLWEKGVLSRETRLSLNVSAQRRLDQIRLALQRWRESNIGSDDYYVFLNIPDFHLELWNGGERKMRFRTVVGSTRREFDENLGQTVFAHATPRLSSKLSHVVFNPYWWVPSGIYENEIAPKVEENIFYMEENDYEFAYNDQGEPVVRQKPGDKNALGKVKFVFDNPYSVFLHDTNEKHWFRWPARAFSHGCIRLQRPMAFAQTLLEAEGRWDAEEVASYYGSGKEEAWVKLERPVPIHLEYYVVRVDDLGRANFLSDLYRHDVARLRAIEQRRDSRLADEEQALTGQPANQ